MYLLHACLVPHVAIYMLQRLPPSKLSTSSQSMSLPWQAAPLSLNLLRRSSSDSAPQNSCLCPLAFSGERSGKGSRQAGALSPMVLTEAVVESPRPDTTYECSHTVMVLPHCSKLSPGRSSQRSSQLRRSLTGSGASSTQHHVCRYVCVRVRRVEQDISNSRLCFSQMAVSPRTMRQKLHLPERWQMHQWPVGSQLHL